MKSVGSSIRINGPLVAKLRGDQGWTQSELADQSGYTERLIRKMEAGHPVSKATLIDICDTFTRAGAALTADDLQYGPVQMTKEFIHGMYVHKGEVINQCSHFVSADIVVEFRGDPAVFPFAGRHAGIDEARNAFGAFYSVLAPPDDISELDSFKFLEMDKSVLVWGETMTHPIGTPMDKPIKLAIRFNFEDGWLVKFDDCFDTQEASKHFETAEGDQAPAESD